MKINIILGVSIVAVILAGLSFYFQQNSQLKVAYVNSQYLITNYEGFREATKAYQQKTVQWQANIDTLAKELNTRIKQYESEKSRLSASEKKLNEELINTKKQQLTQYQQGIRQKAQQEDQQMTGALVEEINAFLKDYGQKKGYKFIFGATDIGNIVYASEAYDLTEEVLMAMNKQYRGE